MFYLLLYNYGVHMYIVADMGRPTGGYRAGIQAAAHGKEKIYGFVYVSFLQTMKMAKCETVRLYFVDL